MGILDILSTKRQRHKESVRIIVEASCCVACADKPDQGDEGITHDEVQAMLHELRKAKVKCSESCIMEYLEQARERVRASGVRTVLHEVEAEIPKVAESGMTSLLLNTMEYVAVADCKIHTNELKIILKFRRTLGLVPERTVDSKKKDTLQGVKPQMLGAVQAMVTALEPLPRKVCFDLTCGLLATAKVADFKKNCQMAWDRAVEQEIQRKGRSRATKQPRVRWFHQLLEKIRLRQGRVDLTDPMEEDIHRLRTQYNSNVTTCTLVVYFLAATIPHPETGRFLEAVGFPSVWAS